MLTRADTLVERVDRRAVWDAFRAAVEAYPDREMLHIPVTAMDYPASSPTTVTYESARALVDELSVRLIGAGFVPGHRVALALDNRLEFFLYLIALNRLGCSVVPINTAMGPEELRFVLSHSDVAAAFVLPRHAERVAAALPLKVPMAVIVAFFATLPRPDIGPRANRDEAALLYTSGTTGTPKGCILTQQYFWEVGQHYTSIGGYCAFRPGRERLITPLPVTHMNALCCSLMAMLITGGCLIQLDRFHPKTWWASVRDSGATCFHYLGVMPAMLLSAPPRAADDVREVVRFGFGAGVDPRHHEAFERRFGVPLIEAWAMTETGGAAWITANEEPRHVGKRCFGRAPPGLEWRVVAETGNDAPRGQPGELWVRQRGTNPRNGFFAGYYKDEAATEAAWELGWFHTGDVVRVDAAGSFFFVDRLKNVIRRSGENIAAVEVESVLLQHPDVHACAVTAVADEVRGEEVFAFVVLREGVAPTPPIARRLQKHCLEMLTYFKAPAYVAYTAVLPQTPSEKLARGQVKQFAADRLAKGDAIDLRSTKTRTSAGSSVLVGRS